MTLEPRIGLEIHVQLATRTRLFSACPRVEDTGAPPNSCTDPVSLGLPGTLPVLNAAAVDLALRLGTAFGAEVSERSRFARKHYFYPDLPKNFQITQADAPLLTGGAIDFEVDGREGRTHLRRAHLEEDAGRSVHADGRTRVDFNRAGAPLLEIVTEPDLRAPDDAAAVVESVRELVRWLGISAGDLEEGNLRCDANVSLHDPGAGFSTGRVELKNLNSIRGLARALEAEIARLGQEVAAGREVPTQTRGWDAATGKSAAQRVKETATDYRFLVEPDLGELRTGPGEVERIRRESGELPREVRRRWRQAGMEAEAARVLTATRARARWCDELLRAGAPAAAAGRFASGDLLARARARDGDLADLPWPAPDLAALLAAVEAGLLGVASARELLDASGGTELGAALDERLARDAKGPSDKDLRDLLAAHPEQVAHYRAGKSGLLGWFVGRARDRWPGQADASRLARDLARLLSEDAP